MAHPAKLGEWPPRTAPDAYCTARYADGHGETYPCRFAPHEDGLHQAVGGTWWFVVNGVQVDSL